MYPMLHTSRLSTTTTWIACLSHQTRSLIRYAPLVRLGHHGRSLATLWDYRRKVFFPKIRRCTALFVFFFLFYYRSICIIDNGASRRRTRNTRYRARRADHPTTSAMHCQVQNRREPTTLRLPTCVLIH